MLGDAFFNSKFLDSFIMSDSLESKRGSAITEIIIYWRAEQSKIKVRVQLKILFDCVIYSNGAV